MALQNRERPDGAAAVAPEPAVRAEAPTSLERHQRRGALRARRAGRGRPARKAAGRDHRHRLRSAARAEGAGAARGANGDRGARRLDAAARRVFDRQGDAYKASVLPRGRAAHRRRDGRDRRLVEVRLRRGRRHRHATANRRRRRSLFKHFGFTVENVVATVEGRAERAVDDPFDSSRSNFHDHQDRHQRLRPHRAHGVSRRRAELRRHRDRRHQRPARARLPRLHAAVRLGARPLQGRDRRRRQHAGRQRQADPPDAGEGPGEPEVGRRRRRHRGRVDRPLPRPRKRRRSTSTPARRR